MAVHGMTARGDARADRPANAAGIAAGQQAENPDTEEMPHNTRPPTHLSRGCAGCALGYYNAASIKRTTFTTNLYALERLTYEDIAPGAHRIT